MSHSSEQDTIGVFQLDSDAMTRPSQGKMIERAQRVYSYLMEYVQSHEALPNYAMIVAALDIDRADVTEAVNLLRAVGLVEPTTLLPVEYREWWREHVAARWSYKALRQS